MEDWDRNIAADFAGDLDSGKKITDLQYHRWQPGAGIYHTAVGTRADAPGGGTDTGSGRFL